MLSWGCTTDLVKKFVVFWIHPNLIDAGFPDVSFPEKFHLGDGQDAVGLYPTIIEVVAVEHEGEEDVLIPLNCREEPLCDFPSRPFFLAGLPVEREEFVAQGWREKVQLQEVDLVGVGKHGIDAEVFPLNGLGVRHEQWTLDSPDLCGGPIASLLGARKVFLLRTKDIATFRKMSVDE